METLGQRPGAGIGVGIERAVRQAAAGEEALQPQHVAIAGRADDDRSADAAFQEADAAQDQRPHDPLAEVGLLHHQVAQPLRGDDEGFDRLGGFSIDQRRPARKLRQLADEVAGAVGDDRLARPEPAGLRDLDLAGQDEDQAGRHRARDHDRLAGGIGSGGTPKRRIRSMSASARTGNIWSRRAAMVGLTGGAMGSTVAPRSPGLKRFVRHLAARGGWSLCFHLSERRRQLAQRALRIVRDHGAMRDKDALERRLF